MPNSDSFEHYLGEEVVDLEGLAIGTFACYWEQEPGRPLLLGIDTLTTPRKTHVAPAKGARLNERHSCVQLSFSKKKVEDAPCLECDEELGAEIRNHVCSYYGASLVHNGAHSPEAGTPWRRINPHSPS